ncbi:hypothetical protein KIL84_015026 [Mauremys mutica]|uniref:Uncharacterized protein n=1 Tax=Mauremys mutica TaxID=74926 RepID=A0A9D4B8I3_9SAUR|nr:hypothetical protein KIL84_015026 [Mauremys mutica]
MAARSMASTVSMRRVSWLLLSGLSSEAQSSLQDLLFDGKALFAEQTDIKLHGLKDSCTTLKTLGLHVPALARPKFNPQQAPTQATHAKNELPYKKLWDYKKRPQRQSQSASSLGHPKANKQGNGSFDGTPWGDLPIHIRDPLTVKLPFSSWLCAFLLEW